MFRRRTDLAKTQLELPIYPEPLDYVPELGNFDAAQRQRIMRDNTRSLNERRPI